MGDLRLDLVRQPSTPVLEPDRPVGLDPTDTPSLAEIAQTSLTEIGEHVAEDVVGAAAMGTATFVGASLVAGTAAGFGMYEMMHAATEAMVHGPAEQMLRNAYAIGPDHQVRTTPEAQGRAMATQLTLEGATPAAMATARAALPEAARHGFDLGTQDAASFRATQPEAFETARHVHLEARAQWREGETMALLGRQLPPNASAASQGGFARMQQALTHATPELAARRRAATESEGRGFLDASRGQVDAQRARTDTAYALGAQLRAEMAASGDGPGIADLVRTLTLAEDAKRLVRATQTRM
ncbi:MAG: hypothetical protein SFX73_17190 [Kofleriaceae bacterium]|nr:hypothetical protein [Kofleriaceae bacterium]